jgi:hypothetical protein
LPTVTTDVKWSPRWVLSIYVHKNDGRERVLYSDGSEHYTCLRETFSKWVGRAKPMITSFPGPSKAPDFELEQDAA